MREGQAGKPYANFSLTEREHSILCLIAKGENTADIARELYISHHTVAQHVATMLRKAGARTRSELVARAFIAGCLRLTEDQMRPPATSVG